MSIRRRPQKVPSGERLATLPPTAGSSQLLLLLLCTIAQLSDQLEEARGDLCRVSCKLHQPAPPLMTQPSLHLQCAQKCKHGEDGKSGHRMPVPYFHYPTYQMQRIELCEIGCVVLCNSFAQIYATHATLSRIWLR